MAEDRALYLSQSERVWQTSLIGPKGHATMRGWMSYHVLQSRDNVQGYSVEGFPDLCLCKDAGALSALAGEFRPGRVLWVELKSERGTVSNAQRVWLDALDSAGQEVMLWTPGDIDEVARILDSPIRVETFTAWHRRRTEKRWHPGR